MMLTVQFVIRLFLAALLPLGVVLPALAMGTKEARPEASFTLSAIAQNPPKADATVTLRDGKFNPATVSAKPGQLIRFVNSDDRDYSLISTDKDLKVFASGIIKPKKSWDFRVPDDTRPDSYPYTCKFRPRAKGTLRITE